MSVCPRETAGLPLDGFERNLIFENPFFFLKSVEKISSLTLTPDKYNYELLLFCSIVTVFNEPDS